MATYSSDKHNISQIMATQDKIQELQAILAAKDKRTEELEKELAEEKRECAEGWRRWKILRDKP